MLQFRTVLVQTQTDGKENRPKLGCITIMQSTKCPHIDILNIDNAFSRTLGHVKLGPIQCPLMGLVCFAFQDRSTLCVELWADVGMRSPLAVWRSSVWKSRAALSDLL